MATPGLGQLIHLLPTYAKKNVRLFEKCCLKLTRERCSVLYNDIYMYICIYIYMNIYDERACACNIYIYIYIYT